MPSSSHYLVCAGREIHYMDWRPDDGATRGTVIAWHGLARTGRDMDELAAHLSARGYRVLCPDTVGRGLSQWASEPEREYCLAAYARLARDFVLQLGIDNLFNRDYWRDTGSSLGDNYLFPGTPRLARLSLRVAL